MELPNPDLKLQKLVHLRGDGEPDLSRLALCRPATAKFLPMVTLVPEDSKFRLSRSVPDLHTLKFQLHTPTRHDRLLCSVVVEIFLQQTGDYLESRYIHG